jgi:CRISPR type III-associated protein (TIGR04423 family)
MNKILKGNFEGYLWKSNATHPDVFYDRTEIMLDDSVTPFYIEGQLWDKSSKKSVSIRFVDGEYLVKEWTVTDDELSVEAKYVEQKSFFPNRMEKVDKLLFLQYWKEVEDPYINDFKKLVPAQLVFVGLKRKEGEK